jgi:hypothetical protein
MSICPQSHALLNKPSQGNIGAILMHRSEIQSKELSTRSNFKIYTLIASTFLSFEESWLFTRLKILGGSATSVKEKAEDELTRIHFAATSESIYGSNTLANNFENATDNTATKGRV